MGNLLGRLTRTAEERLDRRLNGAGRQAAHNFRTLPPDQSPSDKRTDHIKGCHRHGALGRKLSGHGQPLRILQSFGQSLRITNVDARPLEGIKRSIAHLQRVAGKPHRIGISASRPDHGALRSSHQRTGARPDCQRRHALVYHLAGKASHRLANHLAKHTNRIARKCLPAFRWRAVVVHRYRVGGRGRKLLQLLLVANDGFGVGLLGVHLHGHARVVPAPPPCGPCVGKLVAHAKIEARCSVLVLTVFGRQQESVGAHLLRDEWLRSRATAATTRRLLSDIGGRHVISGQELIGRHQRLFALR